MNPPRRRQLRPEAPAKIVATYSSVQEGAGVATHVRFGSSEEHSERVQDRKHRDDSACTMRTPSRMEFSERTSGGGAINAPAYRGSAGAAVHRQQKRRVDLHVVDTAADQLVEGFGA